MKMNALRQSRDAFFFIYGTNDQVLYNQFSPYLFSELPPFNGRYRQVWLYFLCRVSWLPIITNLGSLNQIRLNEYQLKSISFNYNICGIWKIFNNTRQRKYGLTGFRKRMHLGFASRHSFSYTMTRYWITYT
jgi:hypothetical protein